MSLMSRLPGALKIGPGSCFYLPESLGAASIPKQPQSFRISGGMRGLAGQGVTLVPPELLDLFET